jgi:hypothetical protein
VINPVLPTRSNYPHIIESSSRSASSEFIEVSVS